MSGTAYVGTSGFAYPDWVPRFYPPGSRPSELLRLYAARLPSVELNNTFYQQPRPERVAAWLAQVPAHFRFVVKAQRGGSLRAFGVAAEATIDWLTRPYRLFGERLGNVLFRVPGNVTRDDERLDRLLRAWPADLPLTIEFQHASWLDRPIGEALAARRVGLCATDLDGEPSPQLAHSAAPVYLRLRRAAYSAAELDEWVARLAPELRAGRDAYVFLRHDGEGSSAQRALYLLERLSA